MAQERNCRLGQALRRHTFPLVPGPLPVALVVSALVLVLNVVGVVAAKAVFRQAVRQVLVEQNLIHACEPSSSSNQAQAVR